MFHVWVSTYFGSWRVLVSSKFNLAGTTDDWLLFNNYQTIGHYIYLLFLFFLRILCWFLFCSVVKVIIIASPELFFSYMVWIAFLYLINIAFILFRVLIRTREDSGSEANKRAACLHIEFRNLASAFHFTSLNSNHCLSWALFMRSISIMNECHSLWFFFIRGEMKLSFWLFTDFQNSTNQHVNIVDKTSSSLTHWVFFF